MQDYDWKIPKRLEQIRRAEAIRGNCDYTLRHYIVAAQLTGPGNLGANQRQTTRLRTPGWAPWIWYGTAIAPFLYEQQGTPAGLSLYRNLMSLITLEDFQRTLGGGRRTATLPPTPPKEGWVSIAAIASGSGTPYLWPEPLIFPPNGRITWEVFNGTGAAINADNRLMVALLGAVLEESPGVYQ